MPEIIRLMPDYYCWPLWWGDTHEPGDIDPKTLPLSDKTCSLLQKWADLFDATLNEDYPPNSSFVDHAERDAFVKMGHKIWKLLIHELSPEYEIWYFDIKHQNLLKQLSEFAS